MQAQHNLSKVLRSMAPGELLLRYRHIAQTLHGRTGVGRRPQFFSSNAPNRSHFWDCTTRSAPPCFTSRPFAANIRSRKQIAPSPIWPKTFVRVCSIRSTRTGRRFGENRLTWLNPMQRLRGAGRLTHSMLPAPLSLAMVGSSVPICDNPNWLSYSALRFSPRVEARQGNLPPRRHAVQSSASLATGRGTTDGMADEGEGAPVICRRKQKIMRARG